MQRLNHACERAACFRKRRTLRRILLETLEDEGCKVRPDQELRSNYWSGLKNLRYEALYCLSFKRLPAQCHLVEDRAERKDIALRIDCLFIQLFRREVADCLEPVLLSGRIRVERHTVACVDEWRSLKQVDRQAKVCQLDAARSQHDVPGIQGAVTNTEFVGICQGARDFHRKRQRLFYRDRPSTKPIRQGLAFDVLHGQPRELIITVGLIKGADVRMMQSCRGAECLFELRGKRLAHDLEGD